MLELSNYRMKFLIDNSSYNVFREILKIEKKNTKKQ